MSPARRNALRIQLHRHQSGKCCYCGMKLVMPQPGQNWRSGRPRAATIEHLRRKADGGTNHPDNLALACRACNTARGAMSWVEFKTIKSGAAA